MEKEFTPIETQEAFDAAIKKRLEQQERVITERFTGYLSPDEVAAQTAALNDQITELGNTLKTANEQAATDAATIDDLRAQVKTHATAAVKSRIAREFDLPFELANRLTGDSEEEIRKDAESLKKSLGSIKVTAPPVTNPNTAGKESDAFRQMLANL